AFALRVDALQLRHPANVCLDDGRQVEVAIRHVDGQHAAVREQACVQLQGLDGEQVDRDGVGREGIDDEVVERCGRLPGERQARVPEHDPGVGLAGTQER